MHKIPLRIITAAALIGAVAVASATPSQAGGGRNAAFAAGVGVGLLGGAAVAGSGYGAYPGYGYSPGYAYSSPGYARYAYHGGGWRHRYHRHWGYR